MNEEEVVNKIINGDKKSFKLMFENYYKITCNYLLQYISDKDVIENIVQEIFINIWDKRKNFNPKGKIQFYLYRSAKNGLINHVKHENVKRNYVENQINYLKIDSSSPTVHVENNELSSQLNNCIKLLPDRCKDIFILVKIQNNSYQEVAEILEISKKTVENQIGIAFNKLRNCIKKYIK